MAHLELYNLSKISSAGKGMVMREVPVHIIRLLAVAEDNTQPKLAALVAKVNKNVNDVKRLAYAQSVNTVLKSKRYCTNPVSEEFERLTKLGGYKTDQRIVIALTQVSGTLDYVACGIGGWSQFDPNDEPDLPKLKVNATFDAHASAGRVAEIDLVCRTQENAPPGTGEAILGRLLGMIAKSRQQGQRRFHAVIANKAIAGNVMPFTRLGQKFGMVSVDTKREGMGNALVRDSSGGRKYFCVCADSNGVQWENKGKTYLGNARALSLCPIKPRSGRSYCT